MKKLSIVAVAALSIVSLARADDIYSGTTKHAGEFSLWSASSNAFVTRNKTL